MKVQKLESALKEKDDVVHLLSVDMSKLKRKHTIEVENISGMHQSEVEMLKKTLVTVNGQRNSNNDDTAHAEGLGIIEDHSEELERFPSPPPDRRPSEARFKWCPEIEKAFSEDGENRAHEPLPDGSDDDQHSPKSKRPGAQRMDTFRSMDSAIDSANGSVNGSVNGSIHSDGSKPTRVEREFLIAAISREEDKRRELQVQHEEELDMVRLVEKANKERLSAEYEVKLEKQRRVHNEIVSRLKEQATQSRAEYLQNIQDRDAMVQTLEKENTLFKDDIGFFEETRRRLSEGAHKVERSIEETRTLEKENRTLRDRVKLAEKEIKVCKDKMKKQDDMIRNLQVAMGPEGVPRRTSSLHKTTSSLTLRASSTGDVAQTTPPASPPQDPSILASPMKSIHSPSKSLPGRNSPLPQLDPNIQIDHLRKEMHLHLEEIRLYKQDVRGYRKDVSVRDSKIRDLSAELSAMQSVLQDRTKEADELYQKLVGAFGRGADGVVA
jgi:hypothetical protein